VRFPRRTTQIDVLQQLADDHFGHDPNAAHRRHVGDLGRWSSPSTT